MYIQFFSKCLQEEVKVGIEKPDLYEKVLIFLHGYGREYERMREDLKLAQFAAKYRLLIVCPDLGNGYYIDHEGRNVGQFLAEELPAYVREKYAVPEKTELLLGGVSMGGYGAVLTAAHYPKAFTHILSVSGAFIAEEVYNGGWVVKDAYTDQKVFAYFKETFGPDFEGLKTCKRRNPLAAIKDLQGQKDCPAFTLTCGSSDKLMECNRAAVSVFNEYNIPCVWHELPGIHDSKCAMAAMEWAFDNMSAGNAGQGKSGAGVSEAGADGVPAYRKFSSEPEVGDCGCIYG